MTATSKEIAAIVEQVTATLGDHPEYFDVSAIVEEIGARYGCGLVNIDAIPYSEYSAIVERYDATPRWMLGIG